MTTRRASTTTALPINTNVICCNMTQIYVWQHIFRGKSLVISSMPPHHRFISTSKVPLIRGRPFNPDSSIHTVWLQIADEDFKALTRSLSCQVWTEPRKHAFNLLTLICYAVIIIFNYTTNGVFSCKHPQSKMKTIRNVYLRKITVANEPLE